MLMFVKKQDEINFVEQFSQLLAYSRKGKRHHTCQVLPAFKGSPLSSRKPDAANK